VTPRDLLALAGAVPRDGLAFVPARDGTTNALALSSGDLFEPLYGPGSAERFAALGPSRGVNAPNLIDDVDTVDDLVRLGLRLGVNTRRAAAALHVRIAA
jgi:2-phospho-L-lactate guanylyltransferase (CobY/MobA/RfbA family)